MKTWIIILAVLLVVSLVINVFGRLNCITVGKGEEMTDI